MKNYALLILALLLNMQLGKAQQIKNLIDDHISGLVSEMKFSGSVIVADSTGVIFKKGYGLSNVDNQIPNSNDTKFYIGSLTKQFTSMLIMQLAEQNQISLNDKIRDWLPELGLKTNAIIKQLLNHTSGIKDYTEVNYKCGPGKGEVQPNRFAKCFNRLEAEFEPGTALSYSNTNYYLLGLLIEKVTGMPYAEALSEHILVPLQMDDTGYSNKKPAKFSLGYKLSEDEVVETSIEDINLAYAAGGMYSTVEDLYKWNIALRSNKLVSRKNSNLIFRENTEVEPSYYGFGWFIDEDHYEFKDHRTFHEGGIDGFSACIDRYLNSGICIIVLSNFEFCEARVDVTEPITKMVFDSQK